MKNVTVVRLGIFLVAWATVLNALNAFSQESIRVLMLGDNGHHRPVSFYRTVKDSMKEAGIDIQYRDDVAGVLTPETLSSVDALLVYGNIDSIPPEQETALLSYVENGGGFVPIHCASYCFLNSPKVIALTGGQFRRHGTGRFITEIIAPDHEIMKGFGGFESWDETYIHHKHNTENRVVLEVRKQGDLEEGTNEEPWTWIRTQGNGRVFYTAWGHNEETWSQPGFKNLLERGIRWAARRPVHVAAFQDPKRFPIPAMTSVPQDYSFTYTDVGGKIPNYLPGDRWGIQGKPKTEMQNPLPAAETVKLYSTPEDFSLKLWACEDDATKQKAASKLAGLAGKPLAMNWDHRGRLWLCESIDYPNELQPVGQGRDRIRICEDTDHDGVADKFTVFASGLSIPTAIVYSYGGVIVQDGPVTVFLKDVDGDDIADFRQELITGWELGDTHGGVSNFQYGLDNWIYGMQGYNDSHPIINGQEQQGFRQGFWRFAIKTGKSDGTAPAFATKRGALTKEKTNRFDEHTIRVTKLEFLRSTDNNTWGLGISEDGLIFGSTANANPSNFLPIPNRYYESVSGWSSSVLKTIADTYKFKPITDKIRQVDQFGGYTAGAGHALYTARKYPKHWWNRTAFVCGPTGHLVGTFVLNRDGAGYRSTSPFNLLASIDEWAAPTMAEVGPDGNVWVIDWYNFIVQHNPTPQGFQTGKGNAYESDLRDKKHGRIYRVVYQGSEGLDSSVLTTEMEAVKNGLDPNNETQLLGALKHTNFLWRRAAQRLLVEKRSLSNESIQSLKKLANDRNVDAVGLNVGSMHAMWVLNGREVDFDAASVVTHPSAGVRRNAILTSANTLASAQALQSGKLLADEDAQVRLTAILKLADLSDSSADIGRALSDPTSLCKIDGKDQLDRWLLDAWTSAASRHWRFTLPELIKNGAPQADRAIAHIAIVAEHAARSKMDGQSVALLGENPGNQEVAIAIVQGLSKGWPREHTVQAASDLGQKLTEVWLKGSMPVEAKSQVVVLAGKAGIAGLERALAGIVTEMTTVFSDSNKSVEERIAAAKQSISMQPSDPKLVGLLLEQATAQSSQEWLDGVLAALSNARVEGLAEKLINTSSGLPPTFRKGLVGLLLSRPQTTNDMLDLIDSGKMTWNDLQLDQKQALREHPNEAIRERAIKLLASKGFAMNADRQKLVEVWMPITHEEGNVANGKAMYLKHCALCHQHGEMGTNIGPNLTGMAVHPKEELLVHILDPSRSVEGNFRTYNVRTVDDEIVTGMLVSESKTALEIINAQAKKQVVLREDIDQLVASQKSLMPEGFENQMSKEEMRDLLEFLTSKGKYVPLSIDTVATTITTRGMFFDENGEIERLVLKDWGVKVFKDIPFMLIDPQGSSVPNAIMLYGPNGTRAPKMPKSVELPCRTSAVAIHMLGGIGGWSYPASGAGSTSVIVRLTYANGQTEDHNLVNGEHFADYIRRVDVPKSEFAFDAKGRQIRYLSIRPKSKELLSKVELIKGQNDGSAPIIMAITIQTTE
ncbi:MAG: PVC-type heme-binding CxxCH protein [Pirellula sp.]